MTVQKFKDLAYQQLYLQYGDDESKSKINHLLEHYVGLTRAQTILENCLELNKHQKEALQSAMVDLSNNVPLQYILGYTEFYGCRFNVDKRVLIPRPETEELVDWVVSNHKNDSQLKMLDVGTGSGCIAISISKALPKAFVYAIDLKNDALEVAKINAINNGTEIQFMEQDILSNEINSNLKKLKFNVIVSNPPYVRESEKPQMSKNVLEFEPATALFVMDQDPLIFYRKIAEFGKEYLENGGTIYFEINEALGANTVELLLSLDYKNIELRKDLFGKDRMIKAVNYE